MSLVNDMLRDLDKRQGHEQDEIDGLVPPPAIERRRGAKVLPLCAGLLLVVLSAASYRWLTNGQSADQEPGIALVEATPAAAGHVGEVASVAAETPPVEEDKHEGATQYKAEQAPAIEVAAGVNAALSQLLAAAEQALADDRLTHPPVDNAYALYRHALLLYPHSLEAKNGIQRIQARYKELIQAMLNNGDEASAETYLKRAEWVQVPSDQLEKFRAELESMRARANDNPPPLNVAAPSASEAPSQERAPPETGAGEESKGSIALSWRSRETALVAETERLLEQGRHPEAVRVLEPFVDAHPNAQRASVVLFDAYLGARDLAGARALQARADSDDLRRFYTARLLMEEGQADAALAVLEPSAPEGFIRPAYLALQAALYQRAGQHARALQLYQWLVELDRRQPNYWLGLGVAAEASGQQAQALRAFVAADKLAPVNPAVSGYIKQRIQALSQ
jgi:tetratricopeptide (TPR) repeat protein